MKNAVSRFGKFLSGMVMPNIGAFIAWGFLTALFIEAGWFPNEKLASMVSPMLTYLLPILIAGQGGKMVAGERGRVIAAIAVVGCICGSDYTMLMGAMVMGPLAGWVIKQFDKKMEGHILCEHVWLRLRFPMMANRLQCAGTLYSWLSMLLAAAVGDACISGIEFQQECGSQKSSRNT